MEAKKDRGEIRSRVDTGYQVVSNKDNYRTNDGDDNACDIDTSHISITKPFEYRATDNGID